MIVGWRGVAVEVTGPDRLLTGLRTQLPAFYESTGTIVARGALRQEASSCALDLPDGLGVEVADEDEFVRAAASRIELTLAHHVPDRVTVHAGVIAHAGRAIVLPGSSLAGKSTLVSALVRAGAAYWSDDLAPLDAQGRVHPYPRAMTRRTGQRSLRHLPGRAVDVRHEPLHVAVVALLRHQPRGSWAAQPISAGRAVLGLVGNCVSMRRDPALALDVLTRTAEAAICLEGTRGEADEAAQALLELLS